MRVVVFQIFACLIFLIFDKCRLTTAAFSFISKAENGLSQNHYHHRRTLQKRAIPALRSKVKANNFFKNTRNNKIEPGKNYLSIYLFIFFVVFTLSSSRTSCKI